jgi:hypothetical protein
VKEVPGHPLPSRSRIPSGPPANLFEAISSCRPAKPCYGKRECDMPSRLSVNPAHSMAAPQMGHDSR